MPSEITCTAVPTSRRGLRPALSTSAMATPVKSKLTSPTQTEEVKAASFIAPAEAKIRDE